MTARTRGWLTVAWQGDLDPQEISDTIGVQPTRVLLKGQPYGFRAGTSSLNIWTLQVGPFDGPSGFEEAIARLLSLLSDKPDAIRLLRETLATRSVTTEVELGFGVIRIDDSDSWPSVVIDERAILFAADIGAYIDIDIVS